MRTNKTSQQYISKSALVAEIEKLKRKIDDHDDYANGWHNALSSVETGINFLEVKEVDLNAELEHYKKEQNIRYEEDINMFEFAKHFFELGMAVSNKEQKGE